MAYLNLLYEKKNRIVYITINRPQVLNAIDPPTGQALCQAINDFNEDYALWVAIITGAGDRAFSAGADLKSVAPHRDESRPAEHNRDVFYNQKPTGHSTFPLQIWKPIIAAVNGYCLGGGLELALSCDIVVASENATFGQMEVTHGWPARNGTFELTRQLPFKFAMEMILTGDRFSAQDALRMGLVNRVVPLADLIPTATRIAERICENPPLAVRAAKELAIRGRDLPKDYPPTVWNLVTESGYFGALDSEDIKEGRRAFVEKRKPVYKGK